MTQPTTRGKPGPKPGSNFTHRIGAWAWNSPRLHSKIIKGPDTDCWQWQGSRGPQGNLFGASKNGRPQMIQVNRLLYMEKVQQPIEKIAVRMQCGNRYCCNPHHFTTDRPNQRTLDYIPVELFRLTISDQKFQNMSKSLQMEIKEMAREFAHTSGIDWEWENRWMIVAASDLLVAQLKYPLVIQHFTAQTIKP